MAHSSSFPLNLRVHRSLDLDEGTLEIVKNTPGSLFGGWVCNTTSSTLYLKFYNAISGTAGTGTPVLTVPIPGNSTDDIAAFLGVGGDGIKFDTGICVGCTTGLADNDTGAPSANSMIVNLFFL